MAEKFDNVVLPDSVRIGPFDVRIREYSDVEAAEAGNYGSWHETSLTICIDLDRPPLKVVDTVIHEVGHALWWVYRLRRKDDQERIVAALATGWTQVWRDNPELLGWMAAMLKEDADG